MNMATISLTMDLGWEVVDGGILFTINEIETGREVGRFHLTFEDLNSAMVEDLIEAAQMPSDIDYAEIVSMWRDLINNFGRLTKTFYHMTDSDPS